MSSPALRAGATPRKFLPLSTAWLIRSDLQPYAARVLRRAGGKLPIVCESGACRTKSDKTLRQELGRPVGGEKSLVAVLGKLALDKLNCMNLCTNLWQPLR